MKIKKKVQGQDVELELVKIKDYPRYGLYQIYKIVNGKRIPAYKECYTKLQLKELAEKDFCISDEEVFE